MPRLMSVALTEQARQLQPNLYPELAGPAPFLAALSTTGCPLHPARV